MNITKKLNTLEAMNIDEIEEQIEALRIQQESIQNQIEELENLSIFYKLHYL